MSERASEPDGTVSAFLDIRGLNVRFGGVHALSDVDLRVEQGQLVGLIGPNGAGKSTLIDAVTGFVRPSAGTITLAGRNLDHEPPHRRSEAGLGRTWQSVELFDDLTVRENLQVAQRKRDVTSSPAASKRAAIDGVCDLLGIGDVLARRPDELSHGQRKLVGVARALAGQPQMLCLDEPAAGLDSTESIELGETLTRIRDTGTAILLVDHDMELVMGICDPVNVIDLGRLLITGPPSLVRNDPRVVAAYLGTSTAEATPTDDRRLP